MGQEVTAAIYDQMTKAFDEEAHRWADLYSDGATGGRYALFQGAAARRVRRRLELASELLVLEPGTEVLDVGCGSGVLEPLVDAAEGRWTGVDIAPQMLATGRMHARSNRVAGAAGELPFRSEAFDALVCLGMMNFAPPASWVAILREMSRVLRPSGLLVLSSLRLDVITWVRSRLHPTLPLPISTFGPLYPVHYRVAAEIAREVPLEVEACVHVRKYLRMPHYSLLKLRKP
jgi:ubiquinone/menaquinone biosynthesis C-methylase UbiE